MGQQQLLLLVLGIVIVGLAVVAGINAFDENQTKSSEDALTNEAFRLASDAKAWFNKPTQYDGGGSNASELTNISWADFGADESVGTNGYETPWGNITLAPGKPVTFTLQTSQGSGSFGTVKFNPDSTAGNQIFFERGGS